MTATGLWQDIGAGENVFTKFLRLLFLLAAAVIFYFLAVLPLTWPQQAVLGLLTLLMSLAMARSSDSYLITLALMMMSHVLHLPLRLLAHYAGDAVLSGSGQSLGRAGRVLHLLPDVGRGLRLRHSLPGILSDHLAAAPRAGGAARQCPMSGRTSTF